MLQSLATQILNPAGTCCSFSCWALFTQQAKAMSERPNETFGYSALDGKTICHHIPSIWRSPSTRFRDSIPHIIYIYILCIIIYIYTQQIIHSFVKFRETSKRSACRFWSLDSASFSIVWHSTNQGPERRQCITNYSPVSQ